MKWIILLGILLTRPSYAAKICDLAGRCYMCHKCKVNHDSCVKIAEKNAYEINTCDFIRHVCETANKCNVEVDAKEKDGET